jgi:hypothetical protein
MVLSARRRPMFRLEGALYADQEAGREDQAMDNEGVDGSRTRTLSASTADDKFASAALPGTRHKLYDRRLAVEDQQPGEGEPHLRRLHTRHHDTWSWSFYTRYDLRNNDLDEVGGYIQYSLDCLVFQLRTAYVNDYQRIDDVSKREDDFRVALMVWLRAEKRTPDDEWLTW